MNNLGFNNRYKVQMTTREIEILNLISLGFTTRDIAGNLFISCETVKSHRRNLLTKTGAKNVASLVRIGVKNGLI